MRSCITLTIKSPRSPRGFLAREIRMARDRIGMTQDRLANAVFVSTSLVRAWESGARLPKPDNLLNLERVLGFGDGETPGVLCRMAEDLIKNAIALEWFGEWQKVEARAVELWSFEIFVVPGLLQTEAYATSVLRAANHNADLEEQVSARLERRKVLSKEDAPSFIALIAESALRNNMGGEKVMYEQLMYLVEMATQENVIIQILPANSLECAGFTGPFAVANFDGGDDVVYVDNAIAGDVIEDPEEVARLRRMFNNFRADALRASESIDFITRLANELWTE
nr:helix-turn-helix transcriptional regulator [Actinomadura macra]